MSREVKRVALDFEWPLNKTWKGYIDNPYVDKGCTNPQCSGGQTALGWYIQSLCHALFQAAADQHFGNEIHPWTREISPCAGDTSFLGGKHPEGLDKFVAGLCDEEVEGLFPQGMLSFGARGSRFDLMSKLFEKAGLKDIYHCKACDGSGMDPEFLERYEAWEDTQPPAGEGWQMWETVSEGSPISPVCKTPEELARYMADNPWGATHGNYHQWLAMIKAGWDPSMVVQDGKVMSGVEAVSEMAKEAKDES